MRSPHFALAVLLITASCSHAPTAEYLVTRTSNGEFAVSVTVRQAPRDSLVLQGYAADPILRVSNVQASGPDQRALPVRIGAVPIPDNDARDSLPTVLVRGPLPSTVTVRYRVQPGKREGDAHMGFTGRCYGYAGERFALVTGRDLFLVPEPAEALGRIGVAFSLPPGWSAFTPWRPEGDHWRADVQGRLAAEHLISASLGLGRFRERSFQAGRTRFRFAFESSIGTKEEQDASERLERAAEFIHARFGRDLGPTYTTITAPDTPEGDEIVGEAWGTGQGRSLAPLTDVRIHDFAVDLIG